MLGSFCAEEILASWCYDNAQGHVSFRTRFVPEGKSWAEAEEAYAPLEEITRRSVNPGSFFVLTSSLFSVMYPSLWTG